MPETKQAVCIAKMQKDIEYIKEFIDNADKHFASKLSEKLVYGMVGMVLIGVASALLAGVIKAAEYLIK